MSREQEIRERLEAATPGPWWRAYGSESDSGEPVKDKADFLTLALNDDTSPLWLTSNGDVIPAVTGDGPKAQDNAELIANAPADLAYLLERNAELERIAKVNGGLYRSAEADLIRVDDATVEKVARVLHGEADPDCEWRLTPDTCEVCRDSLHKARAVLAALNQGGETNDE